jgi:endonuclease/exonuclease/phosphatase family metal-dependent hydrolase
VLRVATFNIRHGARIDGPVDHRALVETCAELDADLIGLQEVDEGRRRSSFRNQAALVAEELGYQFVYHAVVRTGARGRYGNALLARAPIDDVELVQLVRPSPRQPRGAILARVEFPRVGVTVAVTHLQNHPAQLKGKRPEAPLQLRGLLDVLTARPRPRILLGDFNLGVGKATPILTAAGYRTIADAPTFPSDAPRITLDYIAVDGLRILENNVVPTLTSDHRAVVATVAPDAFAELR